MDWTELAARVAYLERWAAEAARRPESLRLALHLMTLGFLLGLAALWFWPGRH